MVVDTKGRNVLYKIFTIVHNKVRVNAINLS